MDGGTGDLVQRQGPSAGVGEVGGHHRPPPGVDHQQSSAHLDLFVLVMPPTTLKLPNIDLSVRNLQNGSFSFSYSAQLRLRPDKQGRRSGVAVGKGRKYVGY